MELLDEPLPGCRLWRSGRAGDARGYFRRLTADPTTDAPAEQVAVSFNAVAGVLRGLHFQEAPGLERKAVHCLRGEMFDVMVDLRGGSPTYGRWTSARLSEANGLVLTGEPGFAHGFLTLTDACLVGYLITPEFQPAAQGGVRWDDPDLAIAWPAEPRLLSDRDRVLPRLRDHDPRTTTPIAAPDMALA